MKKIFILLTLSNIAFSGAIDWDKKFLLSDRMVKVIREANTPDGELWTDVLRMEVMQHILEQEPNYRYLEVLRVLAAHVEDVDLNIEAQIRAKTYWDKVYPTPKAMVAAIERGEIDNKSIWQLSSYVQSKGDPAYAPVAEAIFQQNGILRPPPDSKNVLKYLRVKSLETQMTRFKNLLRGHARSKLSKGVVSLALEHIAHPDADDGDRWYLLHAIAPNFNREFGELVPEFEKMFKAVSKDSTDSRVVGLAGIVLARAIAFSEKPEKRARKTLQKIYATLSKKPGPRQRQLAALALVSGEDPEIKNAVEIEVDRLSGLNQSLSQSEKYFVENHVLSLPLAEARKFLSHDRLASVSAPMIWERMRESIRSIDFKDPETLKTLLFVSEINRTPAGNKDVKFRVETNGILMAIDPRSIVDEVVRSKSRDLKRLARVLLEVRRKRTATTSVEILEEIFPNNRKSRKTATTKKPRPRAPLDPDDVGAHLAILKESLPRRRSKKVKPKVKAKENSGEKSKLRSSWEAGTRALTEQLFAQALKDKTLPDDMVAVMPEVLENATDDLTKQQAYLVAARFENIDPLPFLNKVEDLIEGSPIGLRIALVEFLSSRYSEGSGAMVLATKAIKDIPAASLGRALVFFENFNFAALTETDRVAVFGSLSRMAGAMNLKNKTGQRVVALIERVESEAPAACDVKGLLKNDPDS